MSRFKEFLKNEAMGAGVNPTLTAGQGWKFPTSMHSLPTSFQGIAQKFNRYQKPEFAVLSKIQYLVQNIASEPQMYGISPLNVVGNPESGGNINGLNYEMMKTVGASRGMKFLPAEFNYAEQQKIFIPQGNGTVTIDLGALYKKMKSEIGNDYAMDTASGAVDQALQKASTPGIGSQALQRTQV